MPKIAIILISCLIGYLFTAWSVYMLLARRRQSPEQRKQARIGLGIILIVLFIGLADSAKSTRDLIRYVKKKNTPEVQVNTTRSTGEREDDGKNMRPGRQSNP